MDAYYFTFRSMTQAQIAAQRLKHHGITAVFLRAPKSLSHTGCGYALQVDPTDVHGVVFILRNAGIYPWRLFRSLKNGEAQEVFL